MAENICRNPNCKHPKEDHNDGRDSCNGIDKDCICGKFRKGSKLE